MTKKITQRGFTIMEIMVALLLLAVLSGTLFHAFTSITPVTNDKQNKAYNVGRQTLASLNEFVRQDTWDNVTPGVNPLRAGAANEVTPSVNPVVALDGTNYQCLFTVSGVDANLDGQEDYRKVEATVSW